MKPTLAFLFFLACGGILLGSQTSPGTSGKPAPLLAELVQMTRAGASDVELLAYAKAHRRELPPEVSDQDLQFLRDSGVSERVVRYMTAIDARIPDAAQQGGRGAVSPGQEVPPSGSYPYAYPQDEGGVYGNAYSDGDVAVDPDSYAYPDSYADNRCGSQWGYDCYPYFNSWYYPYFYPYTFFAFQPFNRFHDHVHHFHGHNGSTGNPWRGKSGGAMTTARVASRDAWRQRSLNGDNASMRRPAALGQRGPARTVLARQGMGSRPGATSRTLASRGLGSSGPARGSFTGGSRAPQANFGNRGSFSRPSSSGSVGHPSFSGGGMHAGGGGAHGGGGARGGGGRH